MIQWPLLRRELGRLALRFILAGAGALGAWFLLAWAPGLAPTTTALIMSCGMWVYWLACVFFYLKPLTGIFRSSGPMNAAAFGVLGGAMILGIYAIFLTGLFMAVGYASTKGK